MDSAKLNDWMQVIGIFAVVASLIFVGLQMKQTHEIAIATQYQQRAATIIEAISARSQIAETVLRMGTVLSEQFESYSAEDMTPVQIGSRWFSVRANLATFDNNHFQWQSGYLNDETWQTSLYMLRANLSNPMGRFIIETRGHWYRESFHQLCDEIIEEIDSASN